MIKIEYVPLIGIVGSIILFLSDLKIKRKKRIKNFNWIKKFEEWSKKLKIDIGKGKNADKLQCLIIKAGIDIKPEVIKLFQYLLPIIVFALIILVKYTNIANAMLNMEQLKEVAQYLNDDSFTKIDTNVDFGGAFLISLLFYFVPMLILKAMSYVRALKSQEEVLMLQTYALMMLKTSQSVQQILIVLNERSKIFKPYLELAVKSYSQDPKETLKTLKKVEDKGFEKIIISLEQALDKNREMSFKYLEKHRVLTKELNKIEKKAKDSQKKVVGILLLIVPLMIFAIIGGYPWFMLSLKTMSDINF